MYNDTPIDLVLPQTVSLKVSKAEPAVKGDTVYSSTKYITCETGLVLNVPMFIEQDEMIKVDTKNSSYMTRILLKILELYLLNQFLILILILNIQK